MWRASRNILSTKANLYLRKVINSPICEACGDAAESNGHVLRNCAIAQEVWELSGIPFDLDGDVFLEFQEFQDFLWHLKFRQRVDEELLGLVCTVASCLWFSRDKVWLGRVRSQALTILLKVH